MGKVDVGAAIAASFRFVGEAWSKAWGILLIVVWIAATVQAIEALKPSWSAASFFGAIATVFATTAAAGALYRLRFSVDHPGDSAFAMGPSGVQWGALEWRILGANLLVGVILFVIAIVLFMVWAIALGIVLSGDSAAVQSIENGDQPEKVAAFMHIMTGLGGVVTAIVLLPSLAGLLWLGSRLSLLTPVAAETHSFSFGKAWSMGNGATLALMLGAIVIFVVEAAIGFVAGGTLGLLAHFTGNASAGRAWGSIAGQAIGAAINTPLFVGLVLYVYRAQRGDTAVAWTFS